MLIALGALAVNVLLKIILFQPLGAVGLATATSVGLWINLGVLIFLALARDDLRLDALLMKVTAASAVASVLLAGVAIFGRGPALALGGYFGSQANLAALVAISAAGTIVYAAALLACLRLAGITLSSLRPSKEL
jgi:putative peptidoglycan lipid II flippase